MFPHGHRACAPTLCCAVVSHTKNGTLTNTAREVQMTHRSIDPKGRSDFDLIRILSLRISCSMLGIGSPFVCDGPEACHSPNQPERAGYDFLVAGLLVAAPKLSTATCQIRRAVYETPPGRWFSHPDFLFFRAVPWGVSVPTQSTNEAPKISVEFVPTIPVLVDR